MKFTFENILLSFVVIVSLCVANVLYQNDVYEKKMQNQTALMLNQPQPNNLVLDEKLGWLIPVGSLVSALGSIYIICKGKENVQES